MATWHTPESARAQWADAPKTDAPLVAYLEAAKRQCLAYAPVQAEGAELPAGFEIAQLMQARALWNTGHSSPRDDSMFPGDIAVRVYPMSQDVKALLRPWRANIGLG